MVNIRLVGDPADVMAILDILTEHLDTDDLGYARSKYNAGHLRVYGNTRLRQPPTTVITIEQVRQLQPPRG